jgi:hypothetical protein
MYLYYKLQKEQETRLNLHEHDDDDDDDDKLQNKAKWIGHIFGRNIRVKQVIGE